MNKIQNQKTNQNKNKNQISRQRTSWGVKMPRNCGTCTKNNRNENRKTHFTIHPCTYGYGQNPKTLKTSHVYSIAPISLSFHQHDTGPHLEIWVMGSPWIVRSERSVGVANSHLCGLISINRSLSISMIIKAHFISPAYLLSPAVFDFTFQILLSLSHDLFMRKRIPCLSFWS